MLNLKKLHPTRHQRNRPDSPVPKQAEMVGVNGVRQGTWPNSTGLNKLTGGGLSPAKSNGQEIASSATGTAASVATGAC